MRIRLLFAALLILMAVSVQASVLPVGSIAPEFKAMDAKGRMRSLSEFQGKIVVLNFWATWCPLCVNELKLLDRIQKQYQDKGVVVLAVATDAEGWSRVSPFLVRRQLSFPVVVGSAHLCQEYGGVEALPQTFFLDRSGKVMAAVNSVLTEQTLQSILQIMQ